MKRGQEWPIKKQQLFCYNLEAKGLDDDDDNNLLRPTTTAAAEQKIVIFIASELIRS